MGRWERPGASSFVVGLGFGYRLDGLGLICARTGFRIPLGRVPFTLSSRTPFTTYPLMDSLSLVLHNIAWTLRAFSFFLGLPASLSSEMCSGYLLSSRLALVTCISISSGPCSCYRLVSL